MGWVRELCIKLSSTFFKAEKKYGMFRVHMKHDASLRYVSLNFVSSSGPLQTMFLIKDVVEPPGSAVDTGKEYTIHECQINICLQG